MFEEVFDKIKQNIANTVGENAHTPAESKEAIGHAAFESIKEEINKVVSHGNFGEVSKLISDKGNNLKDAESYKNIIHSFSEKAGNILQLDAHKAVEYSEQLIPKVLDNIKTEFKDFDFKSLMSKLSLTDMMKLMSSMKGEGGGLLTKMKGWFGK